MNIKRIKRKIQAGIDLFRGNSKYSYSQFGEDLLIDSFFVNALKIEQPSYLDIGANNPKAGSNTYFFYLKKSYGVCIEPDISLYKKLTSTRPRDITINAGVGINNLAEARFYYFPEPYTGWNTFSKEDADMKKTETGIAYKDDKIIPFVNINTIIAEHFEKAPDFISLDVEGLDLAILETLNYEKHAPKLFCIETMDFSANHVGKKNEEIVSFLLAKGYTVYADTYVNSIFVKKELLPV